MSFPGNNSTNNAKAREAEIGHQLATSFGPAVLGLSVSLEPTGDLQPLPVDHGVYSGFVLSSRDRWFFITAGHALEPIEKAISMGYRVRHSAFIELLGQSSQMIEFSYMRRQRVAVNEGDVDIAVIQIHEMTRQVLEAGGASPITSRNVASPDDSHEAYAVVGIPEEAVQRVEEGDGVRLRLTHVVLPLNRLDDEITGGVRKLVFQAARQGAFIDDAPLQSVVGMSGGLIIALRRGVTTEYTGIGVQTSWMRDTWRLIGMPLLNVAKHLDSL